MPTIITQDNYERDPLVIIDKCAECSRYNSLFCKSCLIRPKPEPIPIPEPIIEPIIEPTPEDPFYEPTVT